MTKFSIAPIRLPAHAITVDNEREIVNNETVLFLQRNIEMHGNDLRAGT